MWSNIYMHDITFSDKVINCFFSVEAVIFYSSEVNFCNF